LKAGCRFQWALAIVHARGIGFGGFYGNTETVRHLRESIRVEWFPHSQILAGPKDARLIRAGVDDGTGGCFWSRS
jgi:hypothetical protein